MGRGALERLLLAGMVSVACATPKPLPPMESPCLGLEEPRRAPRRDYPDSEWVVGLGRVSGGWSSATMEERARAAAQREVASQLLVRVQSTLDVTESDSTSAGASSRVEQKSRSVVDELPLPGLRQVQTCFDPATMTTMALAAMHRGEAARALTKLHGDEARQLREQVTELRTLLDGRSTLQALKLAGGLNEGARRFRAQSLLSAALGLDESEPALVKELSAMLQELAKQKQIAVTRKGRMGEAAFAPLASTATDVATAAGWKAVGAAQALVHLELTVEECQQQRVMQLGGLRVRCALSYALVETKSGQLLDSGQAPPLESVGANEAMALAAAVRQGQPAFQRALSQTLSTLGASR
jgi:hypothetical protein